MPQAAETKDLILDTAESLFSENGVEGVSLRALTRAAGVNLASVHYHFGSKEAVAKAVFARRVRPINMERIALLDEVERSGSARVEDIFTALFAPILRIAQDPDRRRCFLRLCARLYSEPAAYLEEVFEEEFAEVVTRFERALARALPGLSRAELLLRMHFAIGVMVHTMLDSDRARRWTEGECDPLDAQGTLEAMVRFVSAGCRADCAGAAAWPGPGAACARMEG